MTIQLESNQESRIEAANSDMMLTGRSHIAVANISVSDSDWKEHGFDPWKSQPAQ